MKSVSFAVPVIIPLEPNLSSLKNTIFIAQSATKINSQRNASNVTRLSHKVALLTETIPGIANASLALIVKNPLPVKGSPHAKTSLIARNVLENYFQSDARLALNQLQEKVVLVTPSSLPLKNWHGIMNVSFALCAKNLWSEKVSSRTKVISFARNVPEKKCWKKWRPKTKSSHLR